MSARVRIMNSTNSTEDPGSRLEVIELRSRNKVASGGKDDNFGHINGGRTFIERQIQSGDTLNKIALQYSVPVSELKRANNLVTDQDLFALPSIRIPVSRLQKDLILEQNAQMGSWQLATSNEPSTSAAGSYVNDNDRTQLILDYDDYTEQSSAKINSGINKILEKADATIAQVRENLPSTGLENGAFHFVEASQPDNTTRNLWILILAVLLIFVVVPLLLTWLEEHPDELKELQYHHENPHVITQISH